jgi:hypothetical protein
VRREQDLSAEQRGRTHVLDDVAVVADENSDATAVRRIDDRVAISCRDVRMLEDMELAVDREGAVRHRDDVRVVDAPVVAALDESRADRHAILAREPEQLLRARTVRHRLGERLERFARQLPYVPVPGEAHLREGDDLDARVGGFAHEMPNATEIVRLVPGSMLELHGGDADVSHAHKMPVGGARRET